MKIKVQEITPKELEKKKRYPHLPPLKPLALLRGIIKLASKQELKDTNFTYQKINMDKINPLEPVLYLMNHSCFLDLKIAYKIIQGRPFNIVMTDDGFVGKRQIMRLIGCIPTMKFISDPSLVKDMKFCTKVLRDSILLYPEASYSFDGTATPLPEAISKIIKLLNVPVVMIKTQGAFLHDPLYNNLQLRKVDVSATMECILTKEDIKEKSKEEIFDIVNSQFQFDAWEYQQKNNITINEPFRADSLNRILYKCPYCGKEHTTIGKGIHLTCTSCNAKIELTEKGYLKCLNNEDKFTKVSSWYSWEREQVKNEINNNTYHEEMDVDIYQLIDMKAIYKVGKGHLIHNGDGFILKGTDNDISYSQRVCDSYSLYSDYYWYEIGDVICIGDYKCRYYCFPTNVKDIVAKVRIAAEELYKLKK